MDLRDKALRAERLGNPLDMAVAARDKSVLQMVTQAVAHKEVLLAFQPVVSAAKGRKVAFHESLLRVLDATGRVIPAGDFLPKIHHTELERDLDHLSLKLALKQLVAHPKLCLSVNMSARAIGYGPWISLLNNALSRHPSVARRLILEISEPSVMELPELVMDFMSDQQPKGVAFALDDYGSGPTSYNLLKDFFFDVIKVDGGFTRKIHKDSENQVLVQAIAQMAQKFDMHCVATRVEHVREARAMAKFGFSFLQGYAIGAPTLTPPWDPAKRKPKAA